MTYINNINKTYIENDVRAIAPEENCPPDNEENYPLFTSTIIYEYCNLTVKRDLLPYTFYRF